MSSPEKKKRKKPSPVNLSTPEPIPSLPNDLLVSCLSRVSILHYPTLSLVSKTFRSLISSPELNKTRSSLNRTEICLYVSLRLSPDSNSQWFTLCLKPNKTLNNGTTNLNKKKTKDSYVLAAIPLLHCPQDDLVAVGSNIYEIGDKDGPSSNVSFLDCRSHTWHKAPSMRVERRYPSVNVLDGKIYVAGGCKEGSWMEVFDVKTQVWELVNSPPPKIFKYSISKSAGVDGKVYIFDANHEGLVYTPKEGKWEMMESESEMYEGWVQYSDCVVDNVLFYYWEGKFKWYDSKVRVWRDLKGVKGLPKFSRYHARLADYGGKIAVFWEKVLASSGYKDKVILCAVIALERRNDEEIWGKVEWRDTVLTVPRLCSLQYAVTATV